MDERLNLKVRRSFYDGSFSRVTERRENNWKSDVNITDPLFIEYGHIESGNVHQRVSGDTNRDCDEKYEFDETLIKDSSNYRRSSELREQTTSLTDSHLNRLEVDVFQDISQELQNPSVVSLESSVKLFKTTVQEIFDNFFKNMKDFEEYKNKFHEIILNSSKRNSIDEMEHFIKDMIQCITASDTSVNDMPQCKGLVADEPSCSVTAMNNKLDNNETKHASEYLLKKLHSIVDACKVAKNSTVSVNEHAMNREDLNKDMLNFYLVSDRPVLGVDIKCHEYLSEVNLNVDYKPTDDTEDSMTSAGNLAKFGAKTPDIFENSTNEILPDSDREIPIKGTSAKNNLLLNEDFVFKCDTTNRSLVSKICSYFCRKVRKNSP